MRLRASHDLSRPIISGVKRASGGRLPSGRVPPPAGRFFARAVRTNVYRIGQTGRGAAAAPATVAGLKQREGWEGKVVLRVKVTPQGKVASATVQKSSGRSVLDDAALEIVQSWSFMPATQGGVPIAGTVSVPFEFQLN
jgi:TonB family protein